MWWSQDTAEQAKKNGREGFVWQPDRWTGEVWEDGEWQIAVPEFIFYFSRIPCSLAVWWTGGVRPDGCTLPWTTLCHAVLFLISWHFYSSCLRQEPYMGIIQHSQRAFSLNYICLVVAFTFHCEINCVSMAAPLDYIMACITVLPHLTAPSEAKGKKCMAMLQAVPFPCNCIFTQRLQSSNINIERTSVKCIIP